MKLSAATRYLIENGGWFLVTVKNSLVEPRARRREKVSAQENIFILGVRLIDKRWCVRWPHIYIQAVKDTSAELLLCNNNTSLVFPKTILAKLIL